MSRRIVTRRRGGFSDAILLPVTSVEELQAIPSSDVVDKTLILVKNADKIFRFDYSASMPPNGTTIIAPTVGSGRWIAMTGSGGAGSSVKVKQEVLPAAGFTFNVGTGRSTITLAATVDASAELAGLQVLFKGGAMVMLAASPPTQAGEYSMSGSTLTVFGNITASGDVYVVVYPYTT